MQRLILWGGVAGLTACLVKPTFVSITPDYDYVDGCNQIVLQGHHLGTEATARIGDTELELVPWEDLPDTPEQATDVGFKYSATVPPSPTGEPGWFDVTMTVDGEDLTVKDGFYYRSCPASFRVDGYSMPGLDTTYTPTVNLGDPISFQGCGLSDDVTVQFLSAAPIPTGLATTSPTTGTTGTGTGTTTGTGTDTGTTSTGTLDTGATGTPTDTGTTPTDTGTTPTDTGTTPTTPTTPTTGDVLTACGEARFIAAEVALTSDCSTAYTHVEIPSLPAGQYEVRLVHTDGTTYDGGVYPHTADTGVTCAPISFVIGGAK